MMKEIVMKNRSYRRFYENHIIEKEILIELIELARYSATGRNIQPLKFIISNTVEMNHLIFPHLHWAGYLKEGGITIDDGERPSAYIIILGDKNISTSFGLDHGIAAQTILLGAVEKGLGGCMIATINHKGLRTDLKIPDQYEILLVLAIGKPKEKVQMDDLQEGQDIKYWRDKDAVHHVPKRLLKDLIFEVK